MSEIGNIYSRYRDALDWSLDNLNEERRRAINAMQEFYPTIFNSLIRDFSWIRLRNGERWARALRLLREQFGDGEHALNFAAIDGTCGKEQLSELLVFYGASYAQGGTLLVQEEIGELRYNRWSPSEDISIVAYLPIPLNRLGQSESEDWIFHTDDEDRSTANIIHRGLMQLAEIYLAYRRIISGDRPPKILLLDHSLSSIMLSTDVMHLIHQYQPDRQTLGWIGAWIDRWGRIFEPADGLVAYSHPMNQQLKVPSWRMNSLAEAIVAHITNFWQIGTPGERDEGRPIDLSDVLDVFRSRLHSEEDKERFIERIRRLGTDPLKGFQAFQIGNNMILPINRLQNGQRKTLRQRWYDLKQLFEHVCEQLFRERRVEALQLNYPQGSQRRGSKWMDGDDIKFLIGLGLRLLIELCWQKGILLLGVAKDSSSCYLTRNYLSVMAAIGLISCPQTAEIPTSDRLVCEMVPEIDDNVLAPWATIEFDSVFMTLRAISDEHRNISISGVRGDVIVPSDGLFLRSLINLFLERRPNKDNPLLGHALFLDRIAYPYFDSAFRYSEGISTRDSLIKPLVFLNHDIDNLGQDVAMLVADLLTRNCFPNAIGQPDPLHRADLGAKALGKKINELVKSSISRLHVNPLYRTFRGMREGI